MAQSRKGSSSSAQNADKETILEVVLMMGCSIGVLLILIWFLSSHRIVYYSAPGLRWLAFPWSYVEPEKWSAINEAYVFFRDRPRSIPLINFLAFANDCLKPLAVFISLLGATYVGVSLLTTKSANIRRRLSPMDTAREIAKVFPAIVPVLHLGPELVANKLPLWRRQTYPEEIWQNETVHGRPMYSGNNLFRDRVETYFRGGEIKDGPPQERGGRRWSKTLGFLIVDLIADAKDQASICFPDRFSSQGKVLFGILCAHAFGGREGKQDYQKACDELNRSCAGQANGLPNLKVAQWIYTKYRMNKDARALFAVHHWEFTYMYSLFLKAKVSGKATHTDFIWLKPLDRFFFYALNNVGRSVAHAEAGACFAMMNYETRCAKLKRLPLRLNKKGEMEANICVHTAVEALTKEFVRYQSSTEDDDNWWRKLGTWTAAEGMAQQQLSMKAAMSELNASQSVIGSLPAVPDTAYDVQMRAKAKAEDDERMLKALKAGSTLDEIF